MSSSVRADTWPLSASVFQDGFSGGKNSLWHNESIVGPIVIYELVKHVQFFWSQIH